MSKEGKKFDGIDITYDLGSLSEVSFWDRVFRREINLDQKLQMCKNAVNAKRWELGEIKGEYSPLKAKAERFFCKIFGREKVALPAKFHNKVDAEIIATEYNAMAYDGDGNKLTTEKVRKAFKERIQLNRELVETSENKLSVEQRKGLRDLVKEHTDSISEQEEVETDDERGR